MKSTFCQKWILNVWKTQEDFIDNARSNQEI